MHRIIIIPQDLEEPIREEQIEEGLAGLQAAVGGGMIEAVPTPFADRADEDTTVYVNEEGKYLSTHTRNERATNLMRRFMFPGDYVSGPLVLAGINLRTGESISLTDEITVDEVERRVALEA